MSYNLTAVATSETLLDLAQALNTDVLSGHLGTLLLIGLGTVIFLGFFFSTRDVRQSAAGTTWIVFILALFLRAMSLVNNLTLFVCLIIAGFAIGFIWTTEA